MSWNQRKSCDFFRDVRSALYRRQPGIYIYIYVYLNLEAVYMALGGVLETQEDQKTASGLRWYFEFKGTSAWQYLAHQGENWKTPNGLFVLQVENVPKNKELEARHKLKTVEYSMPWSSVRNAHRLCSCGDICQEGKVTKGEVLHRHFKYSRKKCTTCTNWLSNRTASHTGFRIVEDGFSPSLASPISRTSIIHCSFFCCWGMIAG